jgi:7,8-dihydropterin-6-yl-methyl-4-(beta-D-ribofuranosyl)aminobenzene 5'-phosphate synthase
MKLAILYNNFARGNLAAGWGFSCLIDDEGQKILFDTGNDGAALLNNLKELGFLAKEIDKIVISHEHQDHIGGLFDLLNSNNHAVVYVLSSFSEDLKNKIRQKAELIEVTETEKITKNIYTTGLIENNPDEQSLILKTSKGVIVIVGCSHPGVEKILEIAKKYGKIHAIIGGLHGFSDFDLLKDIKIIGACHCTQHIKEIREKFPKQFKEIKAGDSLEWS